ncbi:MAG TPA: beta-N-acetylhexosaminidase [Thermoanaerobaculia bacterium]|nr:beta-N-acetylhexosaminidase [Thermoanaerobaculia bacterium]
MEQDLFAIGLTGQSITDLERRILKEASPYAVVLFGRNIGGAEQLRELVREIKSLAARPPVMMIDQEGGRVDRLRHLIPGLPSAEAFAEGEKPAEMSAWLGRVIGMALRYFDVECDLAPVVDIRGEASPKGLERRTFGSDAKSVIELAGAFLRGLHERGTASCLKHFPGIGIGSADPHYGATVIDVPLETLLDRDLAPYAALGPEAKAIMISHGTYPQVDESGLPATLSRTMTHDLLRNRLHFDGIAISDDMEMHAVSDLGSYESISERALMAGNDVIMFCSHIERVPDLQRYLANRVAEDGTVRAQFEEAVRRCEAYRGHCETLRAAAPVAASFDEVIDEAVQFVEEFQRTRPEREVFVPDVDRRNNPRTPGKGRTGREEWT